MAVPDFQTLMYPILRLLGDGEEHRSQADLDVLARELGLSDADREEWLPSRRQRLFENRVAWAKTYLVKAGLVERTGRGVVRITDSGRAVLRTDARRIDIPYLLRFPEFEAFRTSSAATPEGGIGAGSVNGGPVSEGARSGRAVPGRVANQSPIVEQTPGELLEGSYQRLRQALADELLARIGKASPAFFEQLVVDLLVAMGYGGSRADAGQAVGRSGDGGIDGIIKEDRLGLDFVYVQAKRWDQTIGRPAVQAFAGSLEGQRARKGVFITTSTFSRDAEDYVTRIEKRIVLLGGEQLAQLMIDYGIGVADVATFHVKRVDADYFGDE